MSEGTTLEVIDAPGLVTVQDAGRPGLAHLGVPRSGWLDGPAAGLGNRLVGNDASAAVLEVTGAGVAVRFLAARWVAVTGATCAVAVDGRPVAWGAAVRVPADGVLRLGPATTGLRSYLAVGGGLDVTPVLGSRSTDTLGGVGPPVVAPGAVLPLGEAPGRPAPVGESPLRRPAALRVTPGPQAHRFGRDAVHRLAGPAYTVGADSNRVGLRLEGPPLARLDEGETPSQGLVLGAVQVPPSGLPVVFLADHPTTGGYPVVAVVDAGDLALCAQLRPGDAVRFAVTPGA